MWKLHLLQTGDVFMPDFNSLTDKQKQIYEYIREKIETRGYGPTVREIGLAFEIKSPNGVMCHLKALEKKNCIIREGFSARAIQLVEQRTRPGGASLPFLGKVAAGSPTLAIEQDERLELGELFAGPENFVLEVRGQSMIEDHIQDGDYVVIRKTSEARDGERVVAMINDEVTLKRFYRGPDHIRLEPANKEMSPIIVNQTEDASILGVLVGVMRKC
jgi:repressor LexA